MASTTSLGFPVVDNVGADSSMLVRDLLQLIVGSGDDSLVNLVEVEILKRANKNAKTTEEWMADTSTVIAAGEFGYATDTKQIKFGDGLNVWANLPEQEMGVADNSVTTEKVVDNAVTNVKLGVMPANTIKGNNTDGQAAPADIPAADILKMIGGQEVIQYAEMPEEVVEDAVVQYVGETNEDYINGAWYSARLSEQQTSLESVILSEGASAAANNIWYCADGYTFDSEKGIFNLISSTSLIVSYASANIPSAKVILGKYCIKDGSSGSAMYYIPPDGTITVAVNAGLYTSQVSGVCVEYTASSSYKWGVVFEPGVDYQTPLRPGLDYQTPLTAGVDYQEPLEADVDYQTPLKADEDYITPTELQRLLNRAETVNEPNTNYGTIMARGIYAGTTDMEDGATPLTSGVIYLVYK